MTPTEKLDLIDLNDQKVSEINLPKRQPGQGPREIVYRGRLFREGGGPDSFYGAGQLSEVPKDAA